MNEKKLSTLVKIGGYLIINVDASLSYFVGGTEFVTPLMINEEDLKDFLSVAVFTLKVTILGRILY